MVVPAMTKRVAGNGAPISQASPVKTLDSNDNVISVSENHRDLPNIQVCGDQKATRPQDQSSQED